MKWLKLIVFGLGGIILIVTPVIWIPKHFHRIFDTVGVIYLWFWILKTFSGEEIK